MFNQLTNRTEVSQLRQAKETGTKAIEDASDIKQDIADIKLLLRSNNVANASNSSNNSNNVGETISSSNNENVSNILNNSTRSAPTTASDQSGRPSNVRTYAEAFSATTAPFIGEGPARQKNPRARHPSAPAGNFSLQPPQPNPHSNEGQRRGGRWSNTLGDGNGNNRRSGYKSNHNRRNKVVGTAPQTTNGFGGSARILDVYVTGCLRNTTPNMIKEHCQEKFALEFIECEEINFYNKWCKSYKVSVHATKRNELLKPEVWPEGVIVGKYFKPRPYSNGNRNEDHLTSNSSH